MAKAPSRPESVRIGPFDVSIKPMGPVESTRFWGTYSEFDHVIELNPSMEPRREGVTFLHEVLHAIYSSRALPDPVDEETVVEGMSVGLAQVWRDNPGLVAYLNHLLK